ncbi:LOW QUALITY PROTEIN: hypothetical protein HID58_092918, partial [Brassica napus]
PKLISLYVIWGFKDDRSGAPKAAGDPYCTLFVCRIFHLTSGETLREVRVCVVYVELRACGWSDTLAKALQLLCFMILLIITVLIIRYVVTFCLVTGASRGYAFVEYETEKEMLRAYEWSLVVGKECSFVVDALHSFINDIPGTRSVWSLKSVLWKKDERTLSEQVEKIKELISEGVPHYNKNQSGRTRKTPESPQVTTMRKRSRQTEDMVEMDMVSPMRSMMKRRRQTEDIMETDVVSPHISETLLVSQPQCCKTTDCGSSNSAGCPFQALGEHLTGVKLSTNNKDKRICIVASHPSSGLSFTLTWVNNYVDEEVAAQLMHGWIPRRLGECHSLTLSYEFDLHHPLD